MDITRTFRRSPRWSWPEIGFILGILLAITLLSMWRGAEALNAGDSSNGAIAIMLLGVCGVGIAGFLKVVRQDRNFVGVELRGRILRALYATQPPDEFDVPNSLHQVLVGGQGRCRAPALLLRDGRKQVIIKTSEFESEEDLSNLLDRLISPCNRDSVSGSSVPRFSQLRTPNVHGLRVMLVVAIALSAAAVSTWMFPFPMLIADPVERWLVLFALSVGTCIVLSIWQAWKRGDPRRNRE